MAAGSGSSRREGQHSPAGAMVVSPRSGSPLLFGVLLSAVSDQGSHRAAGDPACVRLSRRRGGAGGRLTTILGRPNVSMVVFRRSCPDVSLLARHCGIGGSGLQSLAARELGAVFSLFPFLRGCGSGVLRVSIGRHVARSRLHLHLLCAARSAPGAGSGTCAFAPEPVLVAVGMVSHLLRVRRGENCQSRLFLASSHGNGRLLSER